MPRRRQLGQLEAEILAALSDSPELALSTAELQARIPGDPAYTTINTVLFRLHDKGLVTRERDGRSFRYRIAVDEARLVADRMHDHLRYASDSFNVLSQFVKTLTADEEAALRQILGKDGP
ncbi:BlaI/MecI/CopY family transcriptional regulator [Actinocorallia sp. API 0066]|uniref:BlaI/MecI/CopY family transcriptional regulator n=1 Tax=Actinocorallia sp. API 0066 TaxID=2896846 RepID=UPI0027E0ECF7|nr:BlaI/MecI/CopY family transcriptional regulator [Actinocorallia sp. API 0066]